MVRGNDRSAVESYWLKQAKMELLQRDPVDAVNDAEALVRFAQKRLDALMQEYGQG